MACPRLDVPVTDSQKHGRSRRYGRGLSDRTCLVPDMAMADSIVIADRGWLSTPSSVVVAQQNNDKRAIFTAAAHAQRAAD